MNAFPEILNLSLTSLAPGDRALVVEVDHADPKLCAKLTARGIVPGVEVGILRAGDPIVLSVDEARWALTRADAACVLVEIIEQPKKRFLQRLLRR